jgi:hypothetical protein
MAKEIFEQEQAWRFCDVCDPHKTRPFSAERAYNQHQTSQRHLKRTGQPLQDVSCPKCGKSLSRGSIVLRHLASGQCPRRKSTPNPISEPSKKHAELRMSRSMRYQTNSRPIRIPFPGYRDVNEKLIDQISRGERYLPLNVPDGFDINYQSPSRNGLTALMAACMQAHTSRIYELINMGLETNQLPLLSMRNDVGDTILDLAAEAGSSNQLNKILRFFVAVACCEYALGTRRNSICGRIAREGFLKGNTLEAADPSCPWGEKLRCLKWPDDGALKDIDGRMEDLDADRIIAVRVLVNQVWKAWGNQSKYSTEWPVAGDRG